MFSQVIYNEEGDKIKTRIISDRKLANLLAQVYFLKESGEEIEMLHNFDNRGDMVGYRVIRDGKTTVFTDLKEAINLDDVVHSKLENAEELWG